MQKVDKKHISIIIIAIVVMFALLGVNHYFKVKNTFVYNKHLDDVVMYIDEDAILLREFSYYVLVTEEYFNSQAFIYNPDNLLDYWNTFYRSGEDSMFVTTLAKKTAFDTFVYEFILADECRALKLDEIVTDERLAQISAEASSIYDELTEEQLANTGLTEEIIETALLRKEYAALGAEYILANGDFTGYEWDKVTQISYAGQYYKDKILSEHQVSTSKFWDDITLSHITVNMQ